MIMGIVMLLRVTTLSALKPARPLLWTAHALLQAKLAVGTKPDKLQVLGQRIDGFKQ